MTAQIQETVRFIKDTKVDMPEVGIILGTGLGGLVNEIDVQHELPYDEIPNFPVSTVESHHGKLIFGKIGNKTVVAMQGRFHYYEGYTMQQITFPVRVMKQLGVRYLLISNAAGALNLGFKKASLMLITDHINLLPDNPLRGKNEDTLGPRFPDMSEAYNKKLNDLLRKIAKERNITLHEGVYVAVPGPNLETPAEYKFLKKIGAEAVGMSTVPEVIVANHMNLPCCAVSVLTDECDPLHLEPVEISKILKAAALTEPFLTKLYSDLIRQL